MNGGLPDPHTSEPVVLEGVTKQFHPGRADGVWALRGVSLTIAPGEFVSVEGPSGGGKTTLLHLMGLLERPTAGRVRFGARDASTLPERERARCRLTGVGFIFQRFLLLPTLTAQENVELPMRALGVGSDRRTARARALLDRVGLEGRYHSFPHELSGGEEQRVCVARALANRPGLLLADEPTGELDRANTESILDLLGEVHGTTGASLMVVTHDPKVAARARRHLYIEDGRIVRDSGATAEPGSGR